MDTARLMPAMRHLITQYHKYLSNLPQCKRLSVRHLAHRLQHGEDRRLTIRKSRPCILLSRRQIACAAASAIPVSSLATIA